jgi:hypothetical protein
MAEVFTNVDALASLNNVQAFLRPHALSGIS